MIRCILTVTLMVVACAHAASWKPDPALVEEMSRKRPNRVYDEAKVPGYVLPDALTCADGSTVSNRQQWTKRRAEILELFRTHMFGRSPGKPAELWFETIEKNPRAMDGSATLQRVAICSRHEGREHRFELILFLPNARGGPVPVFVLINNRPAENTDPTRQQQSDFWPAEEMIARGFGMAAFSNAELAPDDAKRFKEGVIRLFEGEQSERQSDAWCAIAAWAWGASRVMDYLETNPRVDASKVAVVGHSRGGKTALWAAAQDERFALAVSNNSGSCGAAISRRRYGETLAMTDGNPHWFCDNFERFRDREDDLPFDQHMLVSLIAPRAVYVTSASEDLSADPKGEFLSLVHSSPVFVLWDHPAIVESQMPAVDTPLVARPRAYHIRTGKHDLTKYDWLRFADFANVLWQSGWEADVKLVETLTRNRPGVVYDEAKVPAYTLPDPLQAHDGNMITDAAQWPAQRERILEMFRNEMFGRSPAKPDDVEFEVIENDDHALDGAATMRRVAITTTHEQKQHRFEVVIAIPNERHGRVPAFILINNRGWETVNPAKPENPEFWPVRAIIARGYMTAVFQNGDLAPDDAEKFTKGVMRLFDTDATTRPGDAWGALGTWAWGASRVLDYLETDPRIDARRVAVVGHSRGGKTALWAAAQDERFAMGISNGSGCGGAALSRRRFGETVKMINDRFPHWFCGNFKRCNDREDELPFDQHMLIALLAPRAVYVASGSEDLWADPRGEYQALAHASPAYELWDEPAMSPDAMPPVGQQVIIGSRGYHIHEGKHNLGLYDWERFMDFADRVWKSGRASR